MRYLAASVLVLLTAVAAADYQPVEWQWRGWTFQTGISPLPDYSMTNLFDGNPATAWAFSETTAKALQEAQGSPADEFTPYNKPYWLTIKPGGKLTLDGIRLMNGYNKSDKAFSDNKRVLELEIHVGDFYGSLDKKPLKTVRLSDKMGWHNISLPKRRYTDGITLRFKRLSDARTEDIALSELQLLKDGRPVDMTPPQAHVFTAGSDCGCGTEYEIRSETNQKIVKSVGGEGGSGPAFSDDGRYIGGFDNQDAKTAYAWIVDTRTGKIVKKRTFKCPNDYLEVAWKRNTLAIHNGDKVVTRLTLGVGK